VPAARLTAAHLKDFNLNTCQAKINATRAQLKTELGLAESDIIDLPVLFVEFVAAGMADALTADVVNMLVVNKTCIIPLPYGPVVGGVDLFQHDTKSKIQAVGNTATFIDDWYSYHVLFGEVHCGTNAARTPVTANWWEFQP
jgi:protein-arginine deiminase